MSFLVRHDRPSFFPGTLAEQNFFGYSVIFAVNLVLAIMIEASPVRTRPIRLPEC